MKNLQILMMGGGFDQQGKYTYQELDDLINVDGYIPVTSYDDFTNLRTPTTQRMGAGSPWDGYYLTGIDKSYVQINPITFSSSFELTDNLVGIYDGNCTTIDLNDNALTSLFLNINGTLKNSYVIGNSANSTIFATNLYGSVIDNKYIGNITAESMQGVYGNITATAVVDGLIMQSTITAGSTIGGAMVGSNAGSVSGCCISGTIISGVRISPFGNGNTGTIEDCISSVNNNGSDYYSSGFIGQNSASGIIRNCYSTGSVNSTNNQAYGGFCGRNYGIIEDCYSTGAVVDGTDAGGFCGINSGTITNSYYDSDTSGQSDTGKGEPKTTIEMQEGSIPDTTIYVSWDDTIWDEVDDNSYPEIINT